MSTINRKLLTIIGNRFTKSALNPQPLPPSELGASVADEIIRTALTAERLGINHDIAFSDLDEWCPIPPRFKFPKFWPPIPEPQPHPEWFLDFQLGFSARFATAAAEFSGTALGLTFEKAVEKSLASIEHAGQREKISI